MQRVHRVAKGAMGIPMPEQIKGNVDRVLQGGLPPVPYRNRNNWSGASPRARSDGTSTACRMECMHSTSEWDSEAKVRVYSAERGRPAKYTYGKWVPA